MKIIYSNYLFITPTGKEKKKGREKSAKTKWFESYFIIYILKPQKRIILGAGICSHKEVNGMVKKQQQTVKKGKRNGKKKASRDECWCWRPPK